MSDGKKKKRFLPALRRSSSVHIPGDPNEAEGLWGKIRSYSRRQSAKMVTAETKAATESVDARTEFLKSYEALKVQSARLSGDGLQKIEKAARDEAAIEAGEINLRLADVNARTKRFKAEAKTLKILTEVDQANATADLLEAKLRIKNAQAKLTSSPADEAALRRKKLKKKIRQTSEKIAEIDKEFNEKNERDEMTHELSQQLARRANGLVQEREELEAELAKL
ncbi:hypothetical protein [uncultured Tateyamaria sp.]|uniref:hypothetical protein n=1 Tax=uncultured Tateyamaria sp. TaxID=455651 RepID=UPI002610C7B1|nr:hypothetical protein [uncultured Tateyamaria sp.]